MAVDVSEMAPAATETNPSPSQVAEAPAPTPVETTPTQPRGRGAATSEGEESPAPETTESSAPPPKPKLSELLKDPDYRREFDGTVGARLQRERDIAAREAIAKHQKAQAEQQAAQMAQWQQAQIEQERAIRQNEDAWMRHLAENGYATDPQTGQTLYLEDYTKAVMERRQAVERDFQANQAERQKAFELSQAEKRGEQRMQQAYRAAIEMDFKDQPKYVQDQLRGKPYYGRGNTPEEQLADAQAQYYADVRKAVHAHYTADQKEKIRAETKKELAKFNLDLPSIDDGGGSPVSAGTYRFMEDAEAAFVRGDIDANQMRALRMKNLPTRT